jgi:2'-5' RNA ligase
MAGEIGGGGAGNVLQSSTEQLAFEGHLDPRELAKQAAVGSGLSTPGALRSLRPSARAQGGAPEPTSRAAMEIESSPLIRATGPAAEEATIRARMGLTDSAEASTSRAARRSPSAVTSEIDQLYEQFTGEQGKAPARQAGEPETPTVIHPNPEIDRKPVLAKTGDGRVIVENAANKSGVSVVKDRSGEPAERKFSSTQANLPKDVADEITAFGRRIPDRDLAEKGRETEPHITLKYGLHGWDPKIAQEALAGEGPITVRLGKVSLFQNDDADVVKVDIDSPDLHRLNQKIADAHPNTETHSTYEPHATIAYVRPGQGRKYAGSNFLEGQTITLDRIMFSGRDGKQVEIPLAGKKSSAPAEAAQVAGEPVSPRWLNTQRRRAAELLDIDPDQIPMIDEASGAAPQNLQTLQAQHASAPSRRPSGGQVFGSGFGALQGLFERSGSKKPTKPPDVSEPSPEGSRRGRVFETIGAAQTVGQLGSPGFVLRNILQHVSHGSQEMVVQGVAGLMDRAASVVTGKRTVGGFRNPIEFVREAGRFMEDYAEGVQQAREAIRRGEPLPGSRLKDMPDPKTLTAFGRRLQKVLTYINEIPDSGNWNSHFKRSMRDQSSLLKSSWARSKPSADKTVQQLDRMIERAWAEADHASMRDKNFMSETLRHLKKALNTATKPLTGTNKFGLGDFVVKYIQIPGALMKRGIEYSPLGIVEAGYYATKGDQRRAVQSLSRAVTGSTTGAGVGAGLAALGILVGPDHDEGQLGQLEREEGVRGYSINMSALKRLAGGGWNDPESRKLQAGDQLVGIDWLQPWALQASAGAAVYDLYSKGRLGAGSGSMAAGRAVYDSLAKALDVMGDQSVLKNFGRYVARAHGDDWKEWMADFLGNIGLDIPSSFVPSLARQTRQVLDPYERDTRPEDPEDFVGEATNRALAQLPGISQRFPTRTSVLTGQPKKTAIGEYSGPVRGLRMLSPAPFTTYQPSDVAHEVGRLTDAGFKVAFTMPKREKGERTSFLRRREEQFAGAFASQAPQLLNHPFYRIGDDETKAEALNDLAKQLRAATRKTIDAKTVDEIIDRAGDRVSNRQSNRLK